LENENILYIIHLENAKEKSNEQKAEVAATSLIIAVLGLIVAACALFIWAYYNKVGPK